MIFIDSNIWCYFFDQSSQEHKRASAFIERMLGKEEILINTVVIIELAHFLVKQLGPVQGKEKIDLFLQFPLIVDGIDYQRAREATGLLCQYSHAGIGGRDATILATLKKQGTTTLATHDASFRRVDWLKIIDPVK